MATFTKINDWLDYALEAANLSSDSFRLALSNTAPASETPNPTSDGNGVLANVTQIAYTNYSDDQATDRTLDTVTSSQTAGTYTLDAGDVVITASGGALPDFRYIYLYDDTVAGDPLVCVWDNGSAISLATGESVTLEVNASGVFTIS